jgi:hypothetical protein
LDLYLHIGMNKVASTAIQEGLAQNRDILLDRYGILVPETGLGRQDRGGKSHYFFSEALGFTNDPAFLPPDETRIAALREAFLAEVAQVRPRSVVVSSEFFVLRRDVGRVRKFFDGFDVKIVLYLRRHDAWLPSLYAQAIRSSAPPRWDRSLESFLDFQEGRRSQHLSYLDLADAWTAAFGEDSLVLRPYEEGGEAPVVILDFLSLVGVQDQRGIAIPQRRHNRAPSAETLSLIDLLQRLDIADEARNAAVSALLEADVTGLPRMVLHPATRARILARYAAEYDLLSRRFLGGAPLFRIEDAELRAVGDGQTDLPPPLVTPQVRHILQRHLAPDEVSALLL